MSMHRQLSTLLVNGRYVQDSEGVWSAPVPSSVPDQAAERELRERVAAERYDDHLAVIARSHSIPVMDHEIDRFLTKMSQGAMILDIGGCWGWHWRRLANTRPDVGVLIIDFVRANLQHARKVLGSLVGHQVALMHANATALPFPDADASASGFDGVWTVQAFQHIPDFPRACLEAHRVLKRGGRFLNYSQNASPLVRTVYGLLGKPLHTEGMLKGAFHLTRANEIQRKIVADIVGGGAAEADRYTECLFQPDLKLIFSGTPGSWPGRLDARLGELPWLGYWIANQRSFEAVKP